MKVELGRDPLFEKLESPIKELKDKQRQRQRQLRLMKAHPTNQKAQSNIEIIDPLPQQLQKYRDQIEFKKTFDSSRASHKLKKYIIEQERNLKCMRLERIDANFTIESSRIRRSEFKLDLENRSQQKQRERKISRQINIPKIQQLFKNQQKQILLYESRVMRNELSKAMILIENGVSRIKSYSVGEPHPISPLTDIRKNTTDKFPHANTLSQSLTGSSYLNEEDLEIDKIIERKLKLSQKLREKLYKQKKQMISNQAKESSENKNLSFFLNIPKKPKKKVILEGVKSVTLTQGDKTVRVTPASSLLFSLNKMANGRQRKQQQLEGLIQNSYQNRDSILIQKSIFYEQQSPFSTLNTSSQFKLRQIMDKKLMHRLELSKEQVNKFVAYLYEIKNYHVILNDTILQVLKEVREILLSGKVMKASDLTAIIKSKSSAEIEKHPNGLILQNLSAMMI